MLKSSDILKYLKATANRRTTHPLVAQIIGKLIRLQKTTRIDLHWVKGHAGLQGNDRADYLAKIAASHKTSIDYDLIPQTRGKQLLQEYYETIWTPSTQNPMTPFIPKFSSPTYPIDYHYHYIPTT